MKRNIFLSIVALAALAGGVAVALFWLGQNTSENMRPEFALADTQGEIRHVDEWDGKLLLLNFWATWCAPCRKEIPLLIEAQKKYGSAGLQIVGLAVDEPEPVREYAAKLGINYPLLVDAMNVVKVQDALQGGAGLPVSVLIDRQGRVQERFIGEMNQDELEALLAPHLP